ncbi:hypothetical protein DFS34DRAFT_70194 [Phlyctochytrium arcticum]|nr:hypothetical protein DFS34DRAFT_70194 [Phlyctochytrium arcticum]
MNGQDSCTAPIQFMGITQIFMTRPLSDNLSWWTKFHVISKLEPSAWNKLLQILASQTPFEENVDNAAQLIVLLEKTTEHVNTDTLSHVAKQILRASQPNQRTQEVLNRLNALFLEKSHETNMRWNSYSVACEALSHGFHEFAYQRLTSVQVQLVSEPYSHWITCLVHIAQTLGTQTSTSHAFHMTLIGTHLHFLKCLRTISLHSSITHSHSPSQAEVQQSIKKCLLQYQEIGTKYIDMDDQSIDFFQNWLGVWRKVIPQDVLPNMCAPHGSRHSTPVILGPIIPSYFFQRRPTTTMQWTLQPSWKSQARQCRIGELLIFKLEGNIIKLQQTRKNRTRKVQFAEVTIGLVFENEPDHAQKHLSHSVSRSRVIKTSFAMTTSISLAGYADRIGQDGVAIRIESRMIDSEGNIWHNGPSVDLPVKLV